MEEKIKTKKKGPVIGVAAAFLAVVAVVLVFTVPMLVNAAMRTFASPVEYYRYIEKRAAKETISDFEEVYEEAVEKYSLSENVREQTEMVLEIGEGLKELLSGTTQAETPEVETVGVAVDAVSEADGTKGAVDINFSVDETEVINAFLRYDFVESMMYAKIPEFGKDFVAIGTEEAAGITFEGMDETIAQMKKVCAALPEKKQTEKILRRYAALVVSCIEEVEVGKGTVEAGDVEGAYTELVVTLDKETMKKIADTVMEELRSDGELERIVKEVCLASGSTDAGRSYEECLNEVENVLEQIKEYAETAEDSLVMTVWVDNKGDVVGRKFELSEDTEFFYAILIDGKEIGCEVSIKTYGVKVSIEGDGARKREIFSGEFKLKAMGLSMVEFAVTDFNLQQFRAGYLNGTVEITPVGTLRSVLKEMKTLMTDEGSREEISFEDVKLILSVANEKDEAAVKIFLENKEKPFAGLTFAKKTGRGERIVIPEAEEVTVCESREEFNAWFEAVDKQTLYDNLEQAGVFREWLEEIKEKLLSEDESEV